MSAVDSDNAPEDGKSESEDTESDVETPEAEAADLITSGRASTSSTGSGECGVSFDQQVLCHLVRVSSLLRRLRALPVYLINGTLLYTPATQDDLLSIFQGRPVLP